MRSQPVGDRRARDSRSNDQILCLHVASFFPVSISSNMLRCMPPAESESKIDFLHFAVLAPLNSRKQA
jgi:hypothetical protein